ncbi:hypothetical protein [Sporosarcina obsidiansis]|uniref:hypothetical protein n=1 Tax=Sporosarcina obsidiansis TaxID=2660748 RepID=UPI00129B6801|nr:hypothetical protein [Sporosarcina obsidiansis]
METTNLINKKDPNSLFKKYKSKIPHLKATNGYAEINDKDPQQKKWFEEFKK